MDYIEREAAIAYAISGRVRTLPTTENGENWIRQEEVRENLKAVPAAVVAPVVRCKDCLYGSENGFICGNVHGLQYAFPNAFCSNGTKRK